MHICPNCQHTSETAVAFCSLCGAAMVEQPESAPVEATVVAAETPAYQQPVDVPVYQQPAYAQPAQPVYSYPEAPVVEEPSKGKTIAGMIMGIAGAVMSGIGALYTFIFTMLGIAEDEEFIFAAFGAAFGFALFSVPLSLVGLLLSKNGSNTMNKIGKILGIVGLAATGAMLFFSFIFLGAFDY